MPVECENEGQFLEMGDLTLCLLTLCVHCVFRSGNQTNIRQLRERITHSFNLSPLKQQEIGEYLIHDQ